jgi:hypothetical protein
MVVHPYQTRLHWKRRQGAEPSLLAGSGIDISQSSTAVLTSQPDIPTLVQCSSLPAFPRRCTNTSHDLFDARSQQRCIAKQGRKKTCSSRLQAIPELVNQCKSFESSPRSLLWCRATIGQSNLGKEQSTAQMAQAAVQAEEQKRGNTMDGLS